MKKLILLITLMVGSLAFGQEDVPYEMFGVWLNGDGEALQITRDGDNVNFIRRSATTILATGTIKAVDGELHVIRRDKEDQYSLAYFVGNETMVIYKPREKKRAWLWTRIQ
jgi:hypothetical protein